MWQMIYSGNCNVQVCEPPKLRDTSGKDTNMRTNRIRSREYGSRKIPKGKRH